jgi:uncharacterized protein YydD (DUF2326 family)
MTTDVKFVQTEAAGYSRDVYSKGLVNTDLQALTSARASRVRAKKQANDLQTLKVMVAELLQKVSDLEILRVEFDELKQKLGLFRVSV